MAGMTAISTGKPQAALQEGSMHNQATKYALGVSACCLGLHSSKSCLQQLPTCSNGDRQQGATSCRWGAQHSPSCWEGAQPRQRMVLKACGHSHQLCHLE